MSQSCGGGEEQPQPWRERRGSTVEVSGAHPGLKLSLLAAVAGARACARVCVCVCVCVYEIEKENL